MARVRELAVKRSRCMIYPRVNTLREGSIKPLLWTLSPPPPPPSSVLFGEKHYGSDTKLSAGSWAALAQRQTSITLQLLQVNEAGGAASFRRLFPNYTHTHRYIDWHKHTLTHTPSQNHTYRHSHTQTNTQIHTHTHRLTHTQTHSFARVHAHTHIHIHTQTYTYRHTHTNTHIHS